MNIFTILYHEAKTLVKHASAFSGLLLLDALDHLVETACTVEKHALNTAYGCAACSGLFHYLGVDLFFSQHLSNLISLLHGSELTYRAYILKKLSALLDIL